MSWNRPEAGSPVPTQTMSGLEVAMAISPRAIVASFWKSGSKVVPLLTVFQTPPEAVAA